MSLKNTLVALIEWSMYARTITKLHGLIHSRELNFTEQVTFTVEETLFFARCLCPLFYQILENDFSIWLLLPQKFFLITKPSGSTKKCFSVFLHKIKRISRNTAYLANKKSDDTSITFQHFKNISWFSFSVCFKSTIWISTKFKLKLLNGEFSISIATIPVHPSSNQF